MHERIAAADAALKAGNSDEAIAQLIALCSEEPAQSLQIYKVLINQLYRTRRYSEGEAWSAKAVALFPRDLELWSLRGIFLRRVGRFPEALAALDQAQKINPQDIAVQSNRGNVLLDMGDPRRAEEVFIKLTRREPRNAEFHRMLARAMSRQGKVDAALPRLRQAVALKRDSIDAWMDLAALENDRGHGDRAGKIFDQGLAANPGAVRLLEAKAILMRKNGDSAGAEAYLRSLLPQMEAAAWLHYQLGTTLSDRDRLSANASFRRAHELEPDNFTYLTALIESLERTRIGDEGANIEEAYQLARKAVTFGQPTPFNTKILNETLIRVCAFDELAKLGSFKALGRGWAEIGLHTALLKQLAAIRTHDDRLELIEQHRIWGREVEAQVALRPIKRPPPRPADGRIRVGFMSSDLRRHPVAYFALPMFDHIDPRFDVFCYSYYVGKEDPLQTYIAERSRAFRWMPDITAQAAAQVIADDQLDILVELGGSTHMNKLEVMAYRPAPRQASWLGYPHSAGLSAIDYFVCDPYSVPPDRSLLLEEPLIMPHTWLALGRAVFSDSTPIAEDLPEVRNGYLTFGTANNPHKYSREVLRTWARVTASVPNARFAFIRPEGGTASFRKNVLAEFEAEGVDASRVVFHTIRGKHMPFYNEVDITLDPFPLTGGTTTTEALWMGVPVVSLKGESFHERLSYSILSNAGLGDLVASDLGEYLQIALQLAADPARRKALRHGLRAQLAASPLGQTETFAKDFYDLLAGAVARPPAKA